MIASINGTDLDTIQTIAHLYDLVPPLCLHYNTNTHVMPHSEVTHFLNAVSSLLSREHVVGGRV